MPINFTKMHALGNDFMVVDNRPRRFPLDVFTIRKYADRHRGVGFDQLLLLEASPTTGADFYYRIFNADGHEVNQCGNGARCLGKFIFEKKLSRKKHITLKTKTGLMQVIREKNGLFTVNFGEPILTPKAIPFTAETQALTYSLTYEKESVEVSVLSLGNPHCVLLVDDIQKAPVTSLGKFLETHPRFPKKTNVEFMKIRNKAEIALRVYERGVGETAACGSGAAAAVVAGYLRDLLAETVTVSLPGGELIVHFAGAGSPVFQTGPADTVFEGKM